MSRSLPLKVRWDVLKRDRFLCQYCGARPPEAELQVDHVRPVASGGEDLMDNLVTACKRCNYGKGVDSVSFFELEREVWSLVGNLPSIYDDLVEMKRSITYDLVSEHRSHDFEHYALELSRKTFNTWDEWRKAAELQLAGFAAQRSRMELRLQSEETSEVSS